MGNIQANLTKQTLADYTNMVNSVVADVYNSAISICASGNDFSLSTGVGCDFKFVNSAINVSQFAGSTCKLDADNINKLSAKFTNDIINKTQQFIDQRSQNKQGWFATAFSFQINNASNSTEVTNQIKNSFDINFTNKCQAVTSAFNKGSVNLCGYYDSSTFDFKQNALTNALVSCVNENIMDIWVTNSVLNELWQRTDQKLASEQAGLSLKWLFIGIAIIVAIMIIVSLIYFFAKHGSKKSKGNSSSGSTLNNSLNTSDFNTDLNTIKLTKLR